MANKIEMNKEKADQKRDRALDEDIETSSVMSDQSDSSTSGYDPKCGAWIVASRSKKKSKGSKGKATETTEMKAGKEREEEKEESNDSTIVRTSDKKRQLLCKGKAADDGGGCITLAEEDIIVCQTCESQFHPTCQDLSVEAYQAISKYELLWLCLDCKRKLMSINEMEKSLAKKIREAEKRILNAITEAKPRDNIGQDIEAKIESMEASVMDQIKEQQVMVESSLQKQQEVVKEMPKFTAELKSSANELKKIVETQEDKETREKSIILHNNIPESEYNDSKRRREYDEASFQNIAYALLSDDAGVEVERVYRLGKKREGPDAKPRLMMVELKRKDIVDQLIKRRTGLREMGFPNIYLTRNLSPDEREKEKALREELRTKGKESYCIFRGKVVLRKATE